MLTEILNFNAGRCDAKWHFFVQRSENAIVFRSLCVAKKIKEDL